MRSAGRIMPTSTATTGGDRSSGDAFERAIAGVKDGVKDGFMDGDVDGVDDDDPDRLGETELVALA